VEALEDRTVPSRSYTFLTIDEPNEVNGTYAFGVNERGQIVGFYFDANFVNHGYSLSGGQYTTLDNPNGVNGTGAYGINAAGQIVGSYFDANFAQHAYLLSGGQYTTIDDPNATGSSYSAAYGINASGQIVGAYADPNPNTFVVHGTLLNHGQYTTIDVPGANQVFQGTYAFGINASGQIVGGYFDANLSLHGYVLLDGQYIRLDDPNGITGTIAYGINGRGQITGQYFDANFTAHGFLLSGGQYTTLDDPNGFHGTYAQGINNSGTIVGYYYDANDRPHGFVAIPRRGNSPVANPDLADSGAVGGLANVFLRPAAQANATSSEAGLFDVGSAVPLSNMGMSGPSTVTMPHSVIQGDQTPRTAAINTRQGALDAGYAFFAGGVTASEGTRVLANVLVSNEDIVGLSPANE
jgi:probable HAF family extracellular repeat protein